MTSAFWTSDKRTTSLQRTTWLAPKCPLFIGSTVSFIQFSLLQCILPLLPVRGNFPRVLTALTELRSLTRSMVARQHLMRGCVLEGLQEALTQFKRLSQNSKQVLYSSGGVLTFNVGTQLVNSVLIREVSLLHYSVTTFLIVSTLNKDTSLIKIRILFTGHNVV